MDIASTTVGPYPSAKAAIALGSNLGDSHAILTAAIDTLQSEQTVHLIARSPLYQTAPVGPPQPDYINACITIETTLPPQRLLDLLLTTETQFGRVRLERWGARSLDLDLLLYADCILDKPGLTIPHPRLHQRAFVLVPLNDIAADWHHPILNKSVTQLLDQLALSQPITGVTAISASPYQS